MQIDLKRFHLVNLLSSPKHGNKPLPLYAIQIKNIKISSFGNDESCACAPIPAGAGIFGMINRHTPSVKNCQVSAARKASIQIQTKAIIYPIVVRSEYIGCLNGNIIGKFGKRNGFLRGILAGRMYRRECNNIIRLVRKCMSRILY